MKPCQCYTVITRRGDFVRAREGVRVFRSAFLVQALASPPLRIDCQDKRHTEQSPLCRLGITVTKKIDKRAVYRNRIKRRLKEAARLGGLKNGRNGYDYIVIARHDALTEPFESLIATMDEAIRQANRRLKQVKQA
jgi:ribonuclease P protein component